MSRASGVWSAGTVAVLACLALCATANATEPYDYSFAFSGAGDDALGLAGGIGVDNSTGPSAHDVYVADPRENRVEKFTPSGEFVLMFGQEVDQTTGGDVCTAASGNICKPGVSSGAGAAGLPWPRFVAVDSSDGPSAGDVYVADESTLRVSKFNSAGALLTSWGEEGHLDVGEEIGGIAIGETGDLFVQSEQERWPTVSVYDQGGSPVSSFSLPRFWGGYGLAVDGSGDLYLNGEGGIEKLEPPETELGLIDSEESAEAVAMDRSGDLFVKHRQGFISEFDSECLATSCTPLTSFGSGFLGANDDGVGLAVDSSTGTIFATDNLFNPSSGYEAGEVAVFYPPGVVPKTITLPSEESTESTAEVLGRVDPAGAGPVIACHFEYVTEYAFNWEGGFREARLAPCDPEPPYVTASIVSASLTGLRHNTTYDYRLVTANAHGASYGGSESLKTTPALPDASTGPVVSLQPEAAGVAAVVGPGSGPSVSLCSVFYVSSRSYATSGWAEARVSPCEPHPEYTAPTQVTAELSNLQPATSYRYRVLAANSEGDRYGEGRQLTTPPKPQAGPPPEEGPEEEEPEGTTRRGHVHCVKHPCHRVFHASSKPKEWRSQGFPASYAWQVAVRSHGHWLPPGHLVGGCVATFRGKHFTARINGCHGHVTLRYVGRATFNLLWELSP